uniref:Putative secreted protein n=1 Tax=Anopheles darlingi TaxID=43151 RepID=A0A2M4DHF7_ANODA
MSPASQRSEWRWRRSRFARSVVVVVVVRRSGCRAGTIRAIASRTRLLPPAPPPHTSSMFGDGERFVASALRQMNCPG